MDPFLDAAIAEVPAQVRADIDFAAKLQGPSWAHPLGTDDLLNLVCRPTPYGHTRRDEYDARVAAKHWRELWPKVQFLD